jgi:hypothetical protein
MCLLARKGHDIHTIHRARHGKGGKYEAVRPGNEAGATDSSVGDGPVDAYEPLAHEVLGLGRQQRGESDIENRRHPGEDLTGDSGGLMPVGGSDQLVGPGG